MAEALSRRELEAAHCWEHDDRVPRRPAMTEFRRRLRYRQARWRADRGHPIGSQPIAPRPGQPARPVGSRLPLAYAKETGANFVTAGALAAACARYRGLLADQATFASVTIEELLDAGVLPAPTVAALRDRYLPGWDRYISARAKER